MAPSQPRASRELSQVALFLSGTGISLIGNVMAGVALPWFVLQTTGSAAQTGLTGFASVLPMAISGILGGPLIDRVGGKRMSVTADLVSAAAIFAIPILHELDLLTFPLLLLLVFVGALLDIPGITARRMLLPGFAQRGGLRSEQMNSAFEMISGISSLAGPAVAGILIGPMGAVSLLWITGSGFLLSAAAVYGVAPNPPTPDPAEVREASGYLVDIREGLAFLYRTRVLLSLAVLFGVTNFLTSGFYSVGLPVFVSEAWGTAARLGFLFTAVGLGVLLGSLVYGAVGHRFRRSRRAVVLIGFIPQPLFLLAFVVSSNFYLLLAAMFLSGFVVGPVNPMSVTVRFEHIPEKLRGRVFATFSAITAIISPIGIVITGFMIDATSVRTSIVVITVLYTLLALVLVFVRPFHELNTPGPYAKD